MKAFLCLLVFLQAGFAATYTVNPVQAVSATNFHSLSAVLSQTTLAPGDEVVLRSGRVFTEQVKFTNIQGTAAQPITIRTSGAGKAVFDGTGLDVSAQGYLIYFAPDTAYINFQNIEVRDVQAGPDQNDRGIFVQGDHITISRCNVHHNPNGIFSSLPASFLTISQANIHHNGTGEGSLGHNIYTQGYKTTIRDSWIHDANGGINIKDRSVGAGEDFWATEILCNRIELARLGGYEIDLSGGENGVGNARLVSNFIRSAAGGNRAMVTSVGNDGRQGVYHFAYNTVVGQRASRVLFAAFNGAEVTMVSNIWIGGPSLLSGAGYLYGQFNLFSDANTNQYSLADTFYGPIDSNYRPAFVPMPPSWIAAISMPEFLPPTNNASLQITPVARADSGALPGALE